MGFDGYWLLIARDYQNENDHFDGKSLKGIIKGLMEIYYGSHLSVIPKY